MDKIELNDISMEQFKELHGKNAYRYAYKDHRTGKWVTFEDIAKKEELAKRNSEKLRKAMSLLK